MGEVTDARALIERICTDFREDEPLSAATDGDGPLEWPDYGLQREHARARSGAGESVVFGRARIGSHEAVVLAFEFGFLGGSVGETAGARIAAAFDRACEHGLPVVSLVASGGSRVQEGIRALGQLQRITRACTRLRRASLAHVTVARDPTTGGMWACLAAGADIVLASPGAAVAFGGSRVRQAGGTDEQAFTAEGKLAAGQVDQVVDDQRLPAVLAELLALLAPERRSPHPDPAAVPPSVSRIGPAGSGWEAVGRARAPGHPRAEVYLDSYFTGRCALSGDRVSGADPGVLCGLGDHDGRTVAYIAQAGTATTPAGFRTAARVLRLAGGLGLPVLTLVDTPGAANGSEAEQDGVGPAIAEVFTAVAESAVPVTTLVIGEGGSGGALALAEPERTWITPDAYFTVIAPESAAAILKLGSDRVPEVADLLRLRPQDLLELGFVRGIVPPDE